MPIIDDAASLAEKNELPVVEGFAVEVAPGFEPAALLTELGPGWARGDGRWLICRFPPKMAQRPTLGEAWTRVRELQEKPGIRFAEPLLVVPSRPKTSADARRLFGAWGWVSDQRDEQIARNSQNLHWAPNLLGCPRAWDLWEKRYPGRQPGDGVLIAQLDTGYTRNPRVLACLQRDHGDDDDAPIGLNFVGDEDEADRQRGALDPLPLKLPLISNPGHGTKIASVIAADRAKNRPWGTAPGARILPLRVSRSVIHMSFQNVCDAFTAAIERPVHIISMSLGGPFASRQLFERVQQALDAGIIVVAAAGNDIPGVVFPARVPGVIACAACNALEAPWRLSGLGSAVTITAPGELVWHEEPCKGDPQTLPAPKTDNGTSYATAQVAGLAALWLSYHGRDALIGHCGGDQRLLPYLFRHCLTASANSLEKLAGFGFGAGLANAETLLEWPLADPDQLRGTRDQLIAQSADMVHFLSLQNWQRLLHLPTFTADLPPGPPVAEQDGQRRLETFFEELLDQPPTALDLTELACLAGADPLLGSLLARIASDSRHWVLPAAIRRYLLRHRSGLSSALARRLDRAQGRGAAGWLARRPDALALSGRSVSPLGGPASPATGTAAGSTPPAAAPAAGLAAPRIRRLKAFAFDPSLQTSSRDVRVNEITIPVTFERLLPGPVGDYLEVVDVDPASACAYAPVDLDHPWLLAQGGLDRS